MDVITGTLSWDERCKIGWLLKLQHIENNHSNFKANFVANWKPMQIRKNRCDVAVSLMMCSLMRINTFYAFWRGYSLNGWTNFHAQYLKRRRLARGGAFSMIEKNRSMTLTFKKSILPLLFSFQNFDRQFLETGTRLREMVSIEVKQNTHGLKIFDLSWPLKLYISKMVRTR